MITSVSSSFPKKIAVLMGGWSAERDVSLDSGRSIVATLREAGHEVREVDVTRDLAEFLQKMTPRPDVVFNALHGTGGEDGVIQGVLEMMAIPYTHSGVRASAVAMNKVVSRQLFEKAGFMTPPWKLMTAGELWSPRAPLIYPGGYVVKPISEGSSVGVFIIKDDEEMPPKPDHYSSDYVLLVEQYLPGREIQVGVIGDEAIGAIEICPKQGFYDYEAKYTEGKADHLMPAPLPDDVYKHVLELGLKAHHVLGCRGVSRSDFIYDDDKNTFYLIETNTHPGMTSLSLLPEIAAYKGISFPELLLWMIENAQCDH